MAAKKETEMAHRVPRRGSPSAVALITAVASLLVSGLLMDGSDQARAQGQGHGGNHGHPGGLPAALERIAELEAELGALAENQLFSLDGRNLIPCGPGSEDLCGELEAEGFPIIHGPFSAPRDDGYYIFQFATPDGDIALATMSASDLMDLMGEERFASFIAREDIVDFSIE